MMFDAARNVLIYPPDQAFRAASACPGSAWLPSGHVALEARLSHLQALRKADLPIIAPMRDYDWPGRHKPFNAQVVTANFLVTTPHACVLSDMGTGKTLSALWAADYLMSRHLPGTFRCLIVTTVSTMSVWADEIFTNLMSRRSCQVLSGDAARRTRRLAEPADFYVVNHDGLGIGASTTRGRPHAGLAAAIAARNDINLVIVDEVSAYRNGSNIRHKVAMSLIAQRPYLWAMTGTPTPNGPVDAYGIAKLVHGVRESYHSYQDRVTYPLSQFKRVPRAGANIQAQKLLQPAVRFAIGDCVDLPPCTVQRRDVELSKEQKEAYAALKRDAQVMVRTGRIDVANEAALRIKLLQIVCGSVYDGRRESHEIDAGPRLSVLEEVIEQCDRKFIIFAPFTNVVEALYSKLKGKYKLALINGSVPQGARATVFRNFQDPSHELRGIVADPGTMAHGLTLTLADTIIWYGPTDRTETYLQANKRIDRPGQKNHTTIVQIVSSPIEKEIFRRLEHNESMQGITLRLAEDK